MDDDDDEDDMEVDEQEDANAGGAQADGGENAGDLMEFHDDSCQAFFAHQKPVYTVSMHPTHHELILSGGEDETGYLWLTSTGETLHALAGHTDSVVATGFSHDGALCATGGMDGLTLVWDVATGANVARIETGSEVVWLHWHPRGPVLLTGTADGQVWMNNLPSGTLMGVFGGVHAAPLTCGGFSPDGKLVYSGAEDGTFALWDPKTLSTVWKHSPDNGRWFQEESVTAAAVAGNLVLVGGSGGNARAVNLSTGTVLSSFATNSESIESIDFSPNLPYAALASTDGKVTVLDMSHMTVRMTLTHKDAVVKALYTADGYHLVTCSTDLSVRVWDSRSGTHVTTWLGHQEPILCMAISPMADIVVTGSDEGTCLVFRPPQQSEAEAAAAAAAGAGSA
ncbi:quinon protein alcohol dehydrogenase-like superfamily [Blastocladiella britannica]|nr:quinon protein alcohol dehydrogenase-like superfamily [Blastocladiella britannica]